MSGALCDPNYDWMTLDEFEEACADKPHNEKWELIGGRVVRLMVGARWEHGRIAGNIARHLGTAFDDKRSSCQVFSESFYMKEKHLEPAMLPDVMVVCGSLAPGATSTAEPTLLVEVLSKGSVARDRHEKWRVYQQLPTLRHYLLAEQSTPHVEVYDRTDGSWDGFRIAEGLDAILDLPEIGVSLKLGDIYSRVF